MRNRIVSGVAGVSAVGLALGLSQLAADLFRRVPSLITSVGSLLIPYTPPAVKDWAVAVFGTSDKAVLNAGTTIIVLVIGIVAGVLGRRNRGNAAALWAVFTGIGLLAALSQPLISPWLVIVTTAIASGAGWFVLRAMLDRLPASDAADAGSLPGASVGRRQVLGYAAGAGAAALATAYAGRLFRGQSRVDIESVALPTPARTLPSPSASASFDVPGLSPLFTPNDEFYRIDTALEVPQIDPEVWTLKITGMVNREVELAYKDLQDLRQVEEDVTIACVSNEVGGDLVGNARWQGVPLDVVLNLAGVQDGATQIVGRSVDGFTVGFPSSAAFDGRGAMVALGMNGEPLPPKHGFPARLIVPGLYGYVSATKWLREIELTTWDAFDAYWVPRGWAKEAPIKTQARIDVPRRGAAIDPGPTAVAGVAWAPTRGIQRVEVRVDGGSWQECELSPPVSEDAWIQWKTTVDLESGDHTLQVRATDGTGITQPQGPVSPRPDGAEGWHQITVRV